MPGKSKDFGSVCITRAVVQAGVLGVTNAGTAAVDMGTSRQGYLIISLTVGTDVPTNVIIQDSADNVTFAALETVVNADVAATGIDVYDMPNMRRYVRATWTRAAAGADSWWSIVAVGDLMVRAPYGT